MNRTVFPGLAAAAVLLGTAAAAGESPPAAVGFDPAAGRAAVLGVPGLVAFWDFAHREPGGERRFLAHVPPGRPSGEPPGYPLDAENYVRTYWGTGRPATYADFPTAAAGPFGGAVRINKETDPDFRPLLLVPRDRLHDTPLDVKGDGRAVSVVVWAVRGGGHHALAGIWHEGTDLNQPPGRAVERVERGRRQYALFAGLQVPGSACGHVSENGGSTFLNRFALHKCYSAGTAPAVRLPPGDAPPPDDAWRCFAMTFDDATDELTGWLDGTAGERWIDRPADHKMHRFSHNAYMQAYYRRTPGAQPGEDPDYPADQFYAPPETDPAEVEVLSEGGGRRVERRRYRYTLVRVELRDAGGGAWEETGRDLLALRKNPWWYPHGLYSPPSPDDGGPFTVGRVIHSSRSVGFTGWIGGVAVFDRALTAAELKALAALARPGARREPAAP